MGQAQAARETNMCTVKNNRMLIYPCHWGVFLLGYRLRFLFTYRCLYLPINLGGQRWFVSSFSGRPNFFQKICDFLDQHSLYWSVNFERIGSSRFDQTFIFQLVWTYRSNLYTYQIKGIWKDLWVNQRDLIIDTQNIVIKITVLSKIRNLILE